MVTRHRIRVALLQLGLWCVCGGVIFYFGYHAVHGDRGLRAHRNFEAEIAQLQQTLSDLKVKREEMETKVQELDPKAVDRDLLDEEARTMLGWLHPNDRVLELTVKPEEVR